MAYTTVADTAQLGAFPTTLSITSCLVVESSEYILEGLKVTSESCILKDKKENKVTDWRSHDNTGSLH